MHRHSAANFVFMLIPFCCRVTDWIAISRTRYSLLSQRLSTKQATRRCQSRRPGSAPARTPPSGLRTTIPEYNPPAVEEGNRRALVLGQPPRETFRPPPSSEEGKQRTRSGTQANVRKILDTTCNRATARESKCQARYLADTISSNLVQPFSH